MKKLALILFLLLFPILGLAQENTALEPGATIHGFTLISSDEIELLHTTMYLFEHDKTGAQLVYLANDDTERAFEISFHTPVKNDKGLPHVFEHAALSGSKKYPDSNLVFSMMYGTYSTFINAVTYTTYTSFPLASLSDDQLFADMDVYLNGVFFPKLMEDERAMMREAYRYELQSPDADLELQGTVYSEMLGSMSHIRMDIHRLERLLFPGSYVGSVSGGLPDHIPEMTYQELLDFHAEYYTPSNCLVSLYGDLDLDRYLAQIDSFFSQFERTEVDLTDYGMRKLEANIEAAYTYPAPADADPETYVFYAIPVKDLGVRETQLINIDLGLMSDVDHLLDREMSAKLPNVSWSVSLDTNTAGQAIVFTAEGIKPEEAQLFRDICDAAIADVHENGFDPEDVQKYADYQRYTNALQSETSGGLSWSNMIASYWDIYRDPTAILDYFNLIEDLSVLNSQNLCNTSFEDALADSSASVLMISTSVPGTQEIINEQRAQQLRDMKAAMSEDEINALVARTQDYYAWAEENTKNSMLSQVTAVRTEDLPEEVLTTEANVQDLDGTTWITSTVEDTDYIYFNLIFDLSDLPDDVLLPLKHMTEELNKFMPTQLYSRTDIQRNTTELTNGLSFNISAIKNRSTGEWRPYLLVSWATFSDLAEKSFALVEEILLHTDLSDLAYIRSTLASDAQSMRTSAVYQSSHLLAISNARRQMMEEYAYTSQFSGIQLIEYYEALAAMDDDGLSAELEKARQALRTVFSSKNVIMTSVGTEDSLKLTESLGKQLLSNLQNESILPQGTPATVTTSKKDTAILINTNINYNLEYLLLSDVGYEYTPVMDVFTNIASDKVLMPVLRFQNSVYSPIFSITRDECLLLNYRDPQLAQMYNDIFPTLGSLVRSELEKLNQEELDGYIGSTYSNLASFVGPITRARTAITNVLTKENTFDLKRSYMETLKALKVEDLVQYADILDKLSAEGLKVSVTSPQAYSECPELFEAVDESYLK